MNWQTMKNGTPAFVRFFFFALAMGLFVVPAPGQKFLLIETWGSPKTKKIFKGAEISYQLKTDDVWHTQTIADFIVDKNLIELEDRYVNINDIKALKFQRYFIQGVSTSLFWFGLGWSGFALVGTLTDGDPDTNYRWSDAIVTGTAISSGWLMGQLLGSKKVKIGKRKKLRLLDLTIEPVP